MAVKRLPYTSRELTRRGPQRVFTGDALNEIAFPIGGIGTGSISLSGRGELTDWQIYNKPAVGHRPNLTFFSLWAKKGKSPSVFRVLEGRLAPPFQGDRWEKPSTGPAQRFASGLQRMETCSFTGAYPFGEVRLKDKAVPVDVTIEGWNPFIPTHEDDSSIPVAIFHVTLKNTTRETVQATLALNAQNQIGWPEFGQSENEWFEEKDLRGFSFTTRRYAPDHPRYGTMVVATPWKKVTYLTQWLRHGWFDPLHHFCNTFAKTGRFDDGQKKTDEPSCNNWGDVSSIGLRVTLKPGATERLPILIAWHMPWHERYWRQPSGCDCKDGECGAPKWKNYYATVWKDALDVARYTNNHLDQLESETRGFHKALFSSSYPDHVLDAASSQMSILKTTTCLRLEDGTFYGWEGCGPNSGCCEGTCTHVWNYAQAMPYLFPRLEKSIRSSDYRINLRDEDGHMQFRMPLPLGETADHGFHAAADGQLGGILKVYREWLISGDDAFLREVWPAVQRSLEYAWVAWDKKKSGLITETHHNTYDIEFHGPEPMAQTFYLAALRAGEEMARHLGDTKKADQYRAVFEKGSAAMDKQLWNGSYYEQKIPAKATTKYQYGKGCLSDMMIGQWYAAMLGLGHLVKKDRVKKSLAEIFKANWRGSLLDHENPQRVYALNDEAGLLLCSWPKGGRVPFPFVYSDEVWCGIEYQVASHLIYEGLVEEGLAVVKGVRDRHDGVRRNPWNEFECGNYYARSMASWAVLLALAGFRYSAPERCLGFDPRLGAEDFRSFFSVDSGWGVYAQKRAKSRATVTVEIHRGTLALDRIDIASALTGLRNPEVAVRMGRRQIPATVKKGVVTFSETIQITPGAALTITA